MCKTSKQHAGITTHFRQASRPTSSKMGDVFDLSGYSTSDKQSFQDVKPLPLSMAGPNKLLNTWWTRCGGTEFISFIFSFYSINLWYFFFLYKCDTGSQWKGRAGLWLPWLVVDRRLLTLDLHGTQVRWPRRGCAGLSLPFSVAGLWLVMNNWRKVDRCLLTFDLHGTQVTRFIKTKLRRPLPFSMAGL